LSCCRDKSIMTLHSRIGLSSFMIGTLQHTLSESDWNLLLRRIQDGKCTPFLGAGASVPALPLGSRVAEEWAQEYGYPLDDRWNLPRVAQFLAVQHDSMFPKEEILKRFANVALPDFQEADEPHSVLADLPLPVYMTTNYDEFMIRALRSRNKDPRRELCRWNNLVKGHNSIFETDPLFTPTAANPIVFHLHGHNEIAESLVLTEDDYLDFLINVSRDGTLIPARIQQALTGASLLFIGYSLADWTFKVLFRGLINATEPSLRRISVTIQRPPHAGGTDSNEDHIREYLDEYFGRISIKVYWGTAREFASELRQRYEGFTRGS
jgi:hypothetical protein